MARIPWRNKGNQSGETSPLAELRSEMDRLFDSFIREPFGALAESFGPQRGWTPCVDVGENAQEVVVRAEVPGVDPQSLEITVTGNRLTLAGEKKEPEQPGAQDFHQVESRSGPFRRTIELPSGVDADQVSAEHAHGIVTIRLKKTQAATSKRIPVKAS